MASEQWSEPSVTDSDRLPWLETAADEDESAGLGRIVGWALVGLVALAAIFGGIYWYQHRAPAPGDGDLIAAPAGDYKVKPDDPGGLKVDGEGDAAVAASGGAGGNGSIATNGLPEAPIVGRKAADAKAGPGASTATASVAGPGGTLSAPPPGRPVPVSAQGGSGALVQLGSFPTQAGANAAWTGLSKRFGYLANLGKSVEKAEVNGRTFYRLKVNAGSAGAAQDLCGKIKVAGEACIVTS